MSDDARLPEFVDDDGEPCACETEHGGLECFEHYQLEGSDGER